MNDTATPPLSELLHETFDSLDRTLSRYRAAPQCLEIGSVGQVANGIARVTGFSDANDNELIAFPDGLFGIAANLNLDHLGIILLGESGGLKSGDEARRTHRVVDVPVGEELLGRTVDALGRALDGRGSIRAEVRWPIERPAPPIMARAPVAQPLQTGIKAVDATIPIGRGQRELILGDRQTGKTAIAVDAILNQDPGMVRIYCAIGQRGAAVARVIDALKIYGAMENCIVVVAAGEDPPGLQFIAPYAATSMAEYFMERGRDVLIVFDDLTLPRALPAAAPAAGAGSLSGRHLLHPLPPAGTRHALAR